MPPTPYCTESDVYARAPALNNDVGGADRIAEGIVLAQATIDGRLAGKYCVPFTSPAPKLIKLLAINLATAWALASAFSGDDTSEPPKLAEYLEARAEGILSKLEQGTMSLTDYTTELQEAVLQAGAQTSGPPPRPEMDLSGYGCQVKSPYRSAPWGPVNGPGRRDWEY